MTELRNTEREIWRFRLRLAAAAGFVLFAFGLLGARLAFLQIWKHEELSTQAENNRIAVVPIVPNRGLILDRNGVVLASNYSAYTLEITPSKVADLEGTIDRIAEIVDVQPRDRKRFKRLLEESKSFESLPIRTKLSDEEVARFTAQRFRFEGVDIKARLFRSYPLGEIGSHLLGYIGRINQAEKDKIDDSDDEANYRGTEYIGKLGVEQSYEAELHGTTGFEEVEMSAGGHPVRRLKSSPPTPGNAVVLSIDIRLQAMIEQLFGDRRGALVAIDPRNGEILAFVSKPNFDPNLFVDGIDAENWKALNESPDKPLLNRALRGAYPPGSTYKPFMALAALTYGKRRPEQAISDPGYFWFGNHKFRDDKEGGHGSVDMYKSIVQSCDTYYYMLANDLGVDAIHDFMAPLGLGQLTGIDIQGELRGILPSTEWKRKAYRNKEQQKWYAGETISLGIGQGYNAFTMLQMAQAEAAMATGGHRHTPHLVKAIENAETRQPKRLVGDELPPLPWKPEHVAFIHKALYGVTQEGTSARSFVGAPYRTGGKTGTAQVVGIKENEKYNANKMEERLRDHALYTAFAPLEEPRIALAMVVENAGFGAGAAAPIARRVFDYLLLGLYPSEEDIAATREAKSLAPIGTPRPIADVPLPGFAVDSAASVAVAASGVASAGGAATGAAGAASGVLPVDLPASGAPATVPVPLPAPVPARGKAVASAR
jgi:penicillin-binding protein 2